ncbi:DUF1788 domain-containing protein [Trichococcus shcherbakoviae]|uniref:DUF1788 domain-containing protein n=1 Tax=Trichococcus shcherbakoviae TaxID=2094020 RepID=UPI002AA8C829|nr:DUF1788 domain-containing protein [Trichococcus shcherbakoviae]
MKQIIERLNDLQEIILEPDFTNKKGLGGEIGFYIFDYDAVDELIVRQTIPDLIQYSKKRNEALRFQVFDLYDMMIRFFEKRGYIEKNIKMEQQKTSEELFSVMRKALKIATNRDVFVQTIREELEPGAIVFITGIGKIYPILRSHILLNNLQIVVEDQPLILFFPGTYADNKMQLFGEFKDDHYYRAFQLVGR